MEKTAMAQLIEWMNTPVNDHTSVFDKAQELLLLEKQQLCTMYIQGRHDNHLDYYPVKHSLETYNEFFGQTE